MRSDLYLFLYTLPTKCIFFKLLNLQFLWDVSSLAARTNQLNLLFFHRINNSISSQCCIHCNICVINSEFLWPVLFWSPCISCLLFPCTSCPCDCLPCPWLFPPVSNHLHLPCLFKPWSSCLCCQILLSPECCLKSKTMFFESREHNNKCVFLSWQLNWGSMVVLQEDVFFYNTWRSSVKSL